MRATSDKKKGYPPCAESPATTATSGAPHQQGQQDVHHCAHLSTAAMKPATNPPGDRSGTRKMESWKKTDSTFEGRKVPGVFFENAEVPNLGLPKWRNMRSEGWSTRQRPYSFSWLLISREVLLCLEHLSMLQCFLITSQCFVFWRFEVITEPSKCLGKLFKNERCPLSFFDEIV